MRPIGDALRGLPAPGEAAPAPEAGRALAPLRLEGGEVLLPGTPPAPPPLAPELARRAALEADPPPPPPPVLVEDDDGERLLAVPARIASVVPAEWKAEAEAGAARLRALLAMRAHPRLIEAWLKRLVVAVAKPPADWRERAAVLVDMLGEEPALCFTAESARAAARRFQWFPSGAELAAFCAEVAKPYRDQLRGLEVVARAPVATGPGRERPPEAVPRVTPEEAAAARAEVEAIQAKAAALRAEAEARDPLPRRPLRTSHASPAAVERMLEEAAARGGRLAAASMARLQAMRARGTVLPDPGRIGENPGPSPDPGGKIPAGPATGPGFSETLPGAAWWVA